jgi:hypothetical protein
MVYSEEAKMRITVSKWIWLEFSESLFLSAADKCDRSNWPRYQTPDLMRLWCLYIVCLDLPVEVAPLYIEDFCRLRNVPAVFFQLFRDKVLFE